LDTGVLPKEKEETYIPPALELLNDPPKEERKVPKEELENNARLLKEKLFILSFFIISHGQV